MKSKLLIQGTILLIRQRWLFSSTVPSRTAVEDVATECPETEAQRQSVRETECPGDQVPGDRLPQETECPGRPFVRETKYPRN